MSKVLLIGEDSMLLETRAAVLRSTGAEIVCTGPLSALQMQKERQCDVAVLCHSLREEICTALTEALRQHWPKTRILLVIAEREWGYEDAKAAVDGISPSTPERLIQRTQELLRRAEPARRGRGAEHGGVTSEWKTRGV